MMFHVDYYRQLVLLLLFSVLVVRVACNERNICGRDSANVISIDQRLAIAVCSANILRVVRTRITAQGKTNATQCMVQKQSLVINPESASLVPFTDYQVETNDDDQIVAVKTSQLTIQVIYHSENNQALLVFLDSSGSYMYTSEAKSTYFLPQKDAKSTTSAQSWTSYPGEAIYGGGNYVNNYLNYKAAPLHMVQMNLEIVIPFFVSSRKYGLLWDSYGETWLNPPDKLHNRIHLLPTPIIKHKHDNKKIYTAIGYFIPPHSGDYWLALDGHDLWQTHYFNHNNEYHLKLVTVDHAINDSPTGMKQEDSKIFTACQIHEINIPKVVTCKASNLSSSETYRIVFEHDSTELPNLYFSFVDPYSPTTLLTKDAPFIDYYFISENMDSTDESGTVMDSIIQSYRSLTGSAKLFSKKVYGFWHCKNRYHNQTALLESAKLHRQFQIPVDWIVQDYKYWGTKGWGPQWDPSLYPNPKSMIQQLHSRYNLSFMVSVWSRFDKNTTFYNQLYQNNQLIPQTEWIDAWNPQVQAKFFQFLDSAHFSIGADAVWLDATEPEMDLHLNKTIFVGSANVYRNTYSLEITKSFYQGFSQTYKKKRPIALTRSSFAGQHRHATAVWTGDTLSSFECLERHIAMSINYQLSGDPYWTEDIGGYIRPPNPHTSNDYKLLLVRWFQFGVFTPIMRSHGQGDTELWKFGNDTQILIVESAIDLRYRLLPYIYSGFQRVQQHGYTMGRGMVFDFLEDARASDISNQFMFGDSFLVAPIYTADSSRIFYLPSLSSTQKGKQRKDSGDASLWRDFYTGHVIQPGTYRANHVDQASMILFVRSSIVVLAPKAQHVDDPAALESLEVRVYAGKNSTFTVFEDDGVDPDPSRPFTTISFSWSEKTSQLVIGKRQGIPYQGMPPSRKIYIVLVRPGRGVGVDEIQQSDASIMYDGKEVTIDLSQVHQQVRTNNTNHPLYFITGNITKVAF